MPTIVDPDGLFDNAVDSAGANIFIDTAARTIKVRNNSAAPQGPVLDETGVTLQALYSFLKQEWKDDPNAKELIAYPFPLIAITPEQFEFRFGWSPADDSSRSLLRTAGWREFALNNSTLKREYIGTISLGNIDGDQNQDDAGDQDFAYYGFFDSANGIPTAGPFDFNFPGEVNQAIQTLDSSAFDYRGDILRLYIRQEGKTFDQTDTTDIGLAAGTTLPYNTQRFPLVEGADLNVVDRDGNVLTDATIQAALAPGQKFGDATIEYLAASELSNTFGYTQDLTDGPYSFGIKVDAVDGTGGSLSNTEIYSWVQYQLRQDSDIGIAGLEKNGKLSDELINFVGSTLVTQQATNIEQGGALTGVALLNINGDDINSTQLTDDDVSATPRGFPFTANVTLTFSQDILNDAANASFFVYYDYLREYTGTSIQIDAVGPAIGDTARDSANVVLTGFNPTPLESVQNPDGLDATVANEKHFKLSGMTTSANNGQILEVTAVFDSSNFAVKTLDDDLELTAETTPGATLRSHPVNSPSAVLVDSAGTLVENNGGVTKTLDAGNLTSGAYSFQYAYDLNSQFDKATGEGAPAAVINVRAIGLDNGSWVEAIGSIARISANSLAVVSAVERNYSDPA